MEIGKISESILKRTILRQIGHRRKEVIVGPGVGEDCSVIEFGNDEVAVISTDPITGSSKNIGTLAVHITANDLSSNGADIIGIMLTILLPEGSREQDLKVLMEEVETVCNTLNIDILGGHTEVTSAVNQPIISVTGVGKAKKERIIRTAGIKPGQEIVMTKWAGLEGTSIIAHENEERLLSRFTKSFIENAKNLIEYISVVEESKVSVNMGAVSMHDITEGGVFGALWEMGEASSVGIEVDINKIPIKQETIEICEFYNLNPYQLISSGAMLIVIDKGSPLVKELEKKGIAAAVIGKVTKGNAKVVINGEERRFLVPPKSDELYKVNKIRKE